MRGAVVERRGAIVVSRGLPFQRPVDVVQPCIDDHVAMRRDVR
jgi:hypothetical protein